MASFIRNWWSSSLPVAAPQQNSSSDLAPPTVIPPQDDDDSGSDTEREQDDDSPPAFPALNSAQRASSSTRASNSNKSSSNRIPRILSDSDKMPPPPVPSLAVRTPGVSSTTSTARNTLSSSLPVPASSAGTLAVPPTTTKPPTLSKKQRAKIALAPGHGALDWANLKSSGVDLRGVDTLMRIPPSVLKQHNKKDDAWTAISGKVYNITPYLAYHPGGEKELMRVAGRDGTKLFALTHAWVNADFMLDACMVGFLVPEPAHDDDDD